MWNSHMQTSQEHNAKSHTRVPRSGTSGTLVPCDRGQAKGHFRIICPRATLPKAARRTVATDGGGGGGTAGAAVAGLFKLHRQFLNR